MGKDKASGYVQRELDEPVQKVVDDKLNDPFVGHHRGSNGQALWVDPHQTTAGPPATADQARRAFAIISSRRAIRTASDIRITSGDPQATWALTKTEFDRGRYTEDAHMSVADMRNLMPADHLQLRDRRHDHCV